jgi:lysozyme
MIDNLRRVGLPGQNLIKEFEELRLVAYLCPAKVWTIGWGSTRGVKPGMVITLAQAQKRFESDCFDAETAVSRNVLVPLNQNQYDALVSFVFNIGADKFRLSTLRRKLNAGDYAGAAKEFPKWKYANGKPSNGLIRRRKMERELFETPAELSLA